MGAALPQGTCPWVAPPPAPPGSSALVPHRAPRAGASALTPSSPGGGRQQPHFTGEQSEAAGVARGGRAGSGRRPDEPRPGPRRSQWARGPEWGDAASAPSSRRPGHVRHETDPAPRPTPRSGSDFLPGPDRPPTAGPQVPAVRLGSHLPFLPWASERRRSLFCGSEALGAGVQLRQGFCQGRWPGRAMSSVVRLRDA